MKKPVFAFLVVALVGCSHLSSNSSSKKVQIKHFSKVLTDNNKNIFGIYALGNNYSLVGFKESDYIKILNSKDTDAEKEMKIIFPRISEKEFIGHKKTFIFCGFIQKDGIAFCDDARCDGVEQLVNTNSAETISTLKAAITTPGVCKSLATEAVK